MTSHHIHSPEIEMRNLGGTFQNSSYSSREDIYHQLPEMTVSLCAERTINMEFILIVLNMIVYWWMLVAKSILFLY